MNVIKIETSKQLWDAYTEDIQTKATDYMEGFGIVKRMACTKTLVIKRYDEITTTQKWFITWGENELIYDIKGNNWVNLDMFEKGESYCKSILLIEVATQ